MKHVLTGRGRAAGAKLRLHICLVQSIPFEWEEGGRGGPQSLFSYLTTPLRGPEARLITRLCTGHCAVSFDILSNPVTRLLWQAPP